MTNLVNTNGQNNTASSLAEAALIKGDLRALSPEMRVNYYLELCKSLGLNPLSKPFEYVEFDGKLILYPKKECANQLAYIHRISFGQPDIKIDEEGVIVSICAKDARGRSDYDIGAVSFIVKTKNGQYRLDRGVAIKKAISQAKRRVILSMVGLSTPDEDLLESGKAEVVPFEVAEVVPASDRNAVRQEEICKENAERVKVIREALGVDIQLVKDYLARYGKNSPVYLSKEQCDNLVAFMSIHAVGEFLDQNEAIRSYQAEVPRLILNSGLSEVEVIKQWVNDVMSNSFDLEDEEDSL